MIVVNKLRVILILCMLSFFVEGQSQDMQFTQFNAAPLYLNPGFTGATIEHRFATNYRNQWTAIPGHFINYTFAYDYNLSEFNSGIGLLFAKEKAGTGSLGSTEIGLLYSYHLQIDKKIFMTQFEALNFHIYQASRNLIYVKCISEKTVKCIEINTHQEY